MIDIKDVAWLAGWLEGEGCFSIYKKGNYSQFRIEFCSTDLDTMKKVCNILRTKETIYLRTQTYTENLSKRKQEYYVHVRGSLAIEWMMTIYSLMGQRRKDKIKEILTEWRDYIQNGSGLCRKCRCVLVRRVTKTGWSRGRVYTYCRHCRSNKVA